MGFSPLCERQHIHRVDCLQTCWVDYSGTRAVGRSENPGMPVLFGGHNLPIWLRYVELTDLPKSGGAIDTGHFFHTSQEVFDL